MCVPSAATPLLAIPLAAMLCGWRRGDGIRQRVWKGGSTSDQDGKKRKSQRVPSIYVQAPCVYPACLPALFLHRQKNERFRDSEAQGDEGACPLFLRSGRLFFAVVVCTLFSYTGGSTVVLALSLFLSLLLYCGPRALADMCGTGPVRSGRARVTLDSREEGRVERKSARAHALEKVAGLVLGRVELRATRGTKFDGRATCG